MTKEQRDAHLRMMSRLPCHTHHASLPMERMNGKRIGNEIEPLVAEMRELVAKGWSRRQIINQMRIGQHTYRRIRTIIDGEAGPNG